MCFGLDNLIFRDIFKYQIRELILENNDQCNSEISLKDYTANVYAPILVVFENLNHLSIVVPSIMDNPSLSICDLPSTTFASSILTKLCIDALSFDDCLYLLDGRLEQLTTFIVRIGYINSDSSIVHIIISLWFILEFLHFSVYWK